MIRYIIYFWKFSCSKIQKILFLTDFGESYCLLLRTERFVALGKFAIAQNDRNTILMKHYKCFSNPPNQIFDYFGHEITNNQNFQKSFDNFFDRNRFRLVQNVFQNENIEFKIFPEKDFSLIHSRFF